MMTSIGLPFVAIGAGSIARFWSSACARIFLKKVGALFTVPGFILYGG